MKNFIKLLDEKTINKIAAGEVIERPASVAKELVENSIDAKSTSIVIEIISGGKDHIRVTDNGTGIEDDDIDVAFLRHSTSKINNIRDLENINSLGFRGEALASISAVSHLEIITKTKQNTSGTHAKLQGGQIISKKEVGCPDGTTIIVKNLFYNVPVRKKFLKSDNTEAAQISNIIFNLALSNPSISFKYIKDYKMILKTPGNNDLHTTIYTLFGKEYSNSLFKISYNGDDIKINGMICNPSFTRGNRKHQYFFINGRYIKDDKLSRVVEEAYKSLIPINRFPVFILFIKMYNNQVDVNVHPTKTEVRFSEPDKLYSVVKESVKEVLKSHSLIPEIRVGNEKKESQGEQKNFVDILNNSNYLNSDDVALTDVNSSNNLNKKGFKTMDISNKFDSYEHDIQVLIYNEDEKLEDKKENVVEHRIKEDVPLTERYLSTETKNHKIPELNIIGHLFDTYILAQDKNEEVFYIVDQHAAHERIMYEKLKNQYESEDIIIQELLAPEIITLTNSEVELINDNISIFEKIGFLVEDFGVNSVILRGVPTIFGNPDSRELFHDILDNLSSNINSSYDVRIEKIMKMACTSAIKAGYNIKSIEINKLLIDLRNADEPYTCPHGRPIIVKMTKYELEKKFKRI